MLYDTHGAESRKLLEIIKAGARVWTAVEVKQALAAAAASTPIGLIDHLKTQRLRYEGDQGAILLAELKRAYPDSFDASGRHPFALNPVKYLSFFASQDAGNYVEPAQRALTTDAGELDESDPRVAIFADRVRASGVDVLMQEAERRVMPGVFEQAIIGVEWSKASAQDVGKLRVRLWWPEDVRMVAHPSAPDDFDAIILFMGKTVTPPGEPQRWAIWSRAAVEDEAGAVASFGPWFHVVASEDGKHAALAKQYEAETLPFLALHLTPPEGSLWVDRDRDTGRIVDALNRMRANLQLVVDMQGHDQYVYAGTLHDSSTLRMGPDKIVKILPNETLTTNSPTPKITEIQNVQAGFLREVAATRENNPEAYSTSTTQQASGVARMIANAPHDAAVRRNRQALKAFEEERLWPLINEVCDAFGPDVIGPGVRVVVTHAAPPAYEEPEAKQRRLQADLDLDIITPARYAVAMGHYATIADAVKAGLPDTLRRAAPTPGLPAAPPPSTDPLMTERETTEVEDDNEGDGRPEGENDAGV